MAVNTEKNTGTAEVLSVPETNETYDIVSDRDKVRQELLNSPEIERITAEVSVSDPNTIVTFGAKAADEIAKASDTVLRSMSMDKLTETGKMMDALANIMDKFDIDEIREDPKGLQKLFMNAKKQLEKIIDKYHTMDEEVEKIYIELQKYEQEIKKSNRSLHDMFNANVNTYHELVKYIVGGEQACKEIGEYISERQAEFDRTGDSAISFEMQGLNQALSTMETRVQDLRMAESVAMQSVPMIQTMEFSNLNLMRKINSAFIITLPVFKQALAQAMLLKRQRIQVEALSKLDEKTNEMLLKNAKNSAEQSKAIMSMSSSSSIKIETLEESWRTIMNGIEETRKIQDDSRVKRIEDQKRLEAIKNEFNEKYNMPSE